MRIFRLLNLFCLTILILNVFGQDTNLVTLEKRLNAGDKKALYDIAPYFDSIIQNIRVGWEGVTTSKSGLVREILEQYCLFTEKEINIWNSDKKQYLDFLNLNNDKIVFSDLATSFLITPIEERNVSFKIREISATRKKELRDIVQNVLLTDWVKNTKIDSLIKHKDPLALLLIASELYKDRSEFSQYHSNFSNTECINLLEFLTETDIGLAGDYKQFSWHIDNDFFSTSKLNLLIFFSKYYNQYAWDDKRSIFINPNNAIIKIGIEDSLFQLLNDKNDIIAMDAFIKLTTCDTSKVALLADEYENERFDHNYTISLFPYKFVKQLVILTDYCRQNNMDYTGSLELKNNISLLKSTDLTFKERYKLENKVIDSLTLDNVTAFEYWALIYEQSDPLTYSAGRILDIFYSRNWSKLLSEKKYLDCFLKKSLLFNRLGIIGNCYSYLNKFRNSSRTTISLLNSYESTDPDIKEQIANIIKSDSGGIEKKEKINYKWWGNKDYKVRGLKKKLTKLISSGGDTSKTLDKISEILSKISYSQIPTALNCIEHYPVKHYWELYSFLERDWGLFFNVNIYQKETRDQFLSLYSRLSEYQLYSYYLDQAGIDYKKADSSLDYDKIYEMLKFDIVDALAGGGSTRDNEVYALIKLLELTFKTTLGFPNKCCNSDNVWACNSEDRAKMWIRYLSDNNLIKKKHNEPNSFHYD